MAESKPIKPGAEIEVEYTAGTMACKVPDLTSQREILVQWEKLTNPEATALERFDAIEAALRVACPGLTEEQKSELNSNYAAEIVTGLLNATRVSDEQVKKSE